MGGSKTRLDFTRPMRTRCGYDIRLYEIFEGRYINGAFYSSDVDIWFARQWDWDGKDSQRQREIDLVNGAAKHGDD